MNCHPVSGKLCSRRAEFVASSTVNVKKRAWLVIYIETIYKCSLSADRIVRYDCMVSGALSLLAMKVSATSGFIVY
jgi:hypothetical protein